MYDDRDGQTTNGYANTTEVWKVLTSSRFDMWTPRTRGKWLSANRWLFVKEMKLKSSTTPEDRLMLSIMIAWKTLKEDIHWEAILFHGVGSPTSSMEPQHYRFSGRMLRMDVGLPWVDLEKQ